MIHLLCCASLLLNASPTDAPDGAPTESTVIVVVGAGGTEEFAESFRESAERWVGASESSGAQVVRVGLPDERDDSSDPQDESDLEKLGSAVEQAAARPQAAIWLVLIGHGTFDGQVAKFNLRGPDLAAKQLAQWLGPVQSPVAIVNCSSCSGPFINELSAPDRIVITATKSGFEHNYSRFGRFMSEAIADPAADLDKDDQTSLLEAYLSASHRVEEFYKQEARLATEHALLDDNGDGLGTPADFFRGIRATKAAKEGNALDGLRAHQFHLVRGEGDRKLSAEQILRRDQLELEIAELRREKATLAEDDYYATLEPLLLELARLYQSEAEAVSPEDSGSR